MRRKERPDVRMLKKDMTRLLLKKIKRSDKCLIFASINLIKKVPENTRVHHSQNHKEETPRNPISTTSVSSSNVASNPFFLLLSTLRLRLENCIRHSYRN